jgi:hypothetical protein
MGSHEFRVELMEVTASVAKHMLDSNADNQRNIRAGKVEQYARDILAGHWPITGDTIKVNTRGEMMDGQHRMLAVRQAATVRPDISVTMLVAFNVDPAAMAVLDTNVPRGLHDMVGISFQTKQSHLVAAVVRRIVQWEQGNYTGASGRNGAVPTHTEALERLSKDLEGFVAAAARGRDVQMSKLAPGAPSGTAFYLFRQIHPDQAHTFFDFLISGANLSETSPILTLRNRFVRADRLRTHEYIALYVRTWNAWREGRKLSQVLVDTSGGKLSNLNFPMPK